MQISNKIYHVVQELQVFLLTDHGGTEGRTDSLSDYSSVPSVVQLNHICLASFCGT